MTNDNPYAPPNANLVIAETGELAGRWSRLLGAVIDGCIGMAVSLPLMFASGYWDRAMAEEQSFLEMVIFGLVGLLAFLAIHGYLLAKHGQTLGKRLAGTRIVAVQDNTVLPLRKVYGLRYCPVAIISMIPVVGAIASLADILFIFRRDKRCLHDIIAGTKVIKANAVMQNIVNA